MAIVSDILQATPAPADGSPTPARTWQWLRDGAAITSATSSAYTTVDADANRAITVRQIETNFMGAASATSIAFATVDPFDVRAALFSASEPGGWYDPSDLSTMFQDSAGTTPVTATGQTVGLLLDKSKGLVLGPELLASGAIGITGTATPATYNNSTGVGSVTRVDLSNQSFVQWSTLSANGLYRIAISCQTGAIIVRIGIFSGTQITSISAGQSATFYGNADGSGRITVTNTSSAGTSTFTVSSVRELPGNHLTQATAASRPIYGIEPFGGRRNLLTFTENLTNGVWGKANLTTPSADTVILSAGTAIKTLSTGGAASASGRTVQFEAKEGTHRYIQLYFDADSAPFVTFDMRDGTTSNIGTATTASSVLVGDGYYRYTVVTTSTTAVNTNFAATDAAAARRAATASTGSFNLRRIQSETGSTATAYQRVGTAFDVTEVGVASMSYVSFDGTDDGMLTGNIVPGTDKAQVFAGLRKLSNAASGLVVETSSAYSSNAGTFALFAPIGAAANYSWTSRGSVLGALATSLGYAAPTTNVISGIGDIADDTATLRANGVQVATSAGDQGTGNYLTYPLYIGRRGGSSLPFNGQIFGLIVRFGTNLDAATISQTETWLGARVAPTVVIP